MYPHHVFNLEPAGTFGMYPICYWQVSGRYFQPEPAMYSRCFRWFPGPLTPSVCGVLLDGTLQTMSFRTRGMSVIGIMKTKVAVAKSECVWQHDLSQINISTINTLHYFFKLCVDGHQLILWAIKHLESLPEGKEMVMERHENSSLLGCIHIQPFMKCRRWGWERLWQSLGQPEWGFPLKKFKGAPHLFLQ